MKVTGILSISNGSGLCYPYPIVAHSLQRLCDNVIIGVDPAFPLDRTTLEYFDFDDDVEIIDARWNRDNRNGGTEIALQMDTLVEHAKVKDSDWVVVLQADEVFHDNDFDMLRAFMERNIDTNVNGFSTERLYFWKDLNTIRQDWNANMVRIFRPGTYSFLAEGTSKDGMYSGPVVGGEELKLPYKIYHYSRVDPNPAFISRRIRNLDSFFHKEDSLIDISNIPDYDFLPRKYDNYSVTERPPAVCGTFVLFSGSHPLGVQEWYSSI